jgi:4'-phosphopantetheinyl transferase
MPLCYKIDNDNFSLGLWELSESEDVLLGKFAAMAPKNEVLKAKRFKYPARKLEWMAARLLMYELLNKVISIEYDENGKPLINNREQCISISHTKGIVAVIVTNNMAGIDIEMKNERVLRIENKFISGLEKDQITEKNKAEYLLAYWSGKETLYKIHGGKGLDFKKNLYISPFKLENKGVFTGEIFTDNQSRAYSLNYFNYTSQFNNNNYLIVYYYN